MFNVASKGFITMLGETSRHPKNRPTLTPPIRPKHLALHLLRPAIAESVSALQLCNPKSPLVRLRLILVTGNFDRLCIHYQSNCLLHRSSTISQYVTLFLDTFYAIFSTAFWAGLAKVKQMKCVLLCLVVWCDTVTLVLEAQGSSCYSLFFHFLLFRRLQDLLNLADNLQARWLETSWK